jgi:hypothetical protein
MPDSDEQNAMDIDQENEFTRDAILENQVYFLNSRCSHCGFTIYASSVGDLLDQEEEHQRKCLRSGGACVTH